MYTNVPPYESAHRARITPTQRYGYATRTPVIGGAVVTHGYRTLAEARRARVNAQRRGEWVSHLLERVGDREWVPADPRKRAMYAVV